MDKLHLPKDQVRMPPEYALPANIHTSYKVGISFVQIGDDSNAKAYLQELDDDLSKFGIRDIVDTTPYSTNLASDPEILVKILLGGVHRRIDVKGGQVLVQRRRD